MCKLTDKNRLSIVNPELCKEWNYKKNYPLTPSDVSHGSSKKVWWLCNKCNHKWKSMIKNRGGKNAIGMCPKCARKKAGTSPHKINSKNLLINHNPALAKEWHLIKNGNLTLENISYGSHKKVWWKCIKCGHEWEADVRKVVKGYSVCFKCRSLAYKKPELIKEWHFNKNKNLTPWNVSYGSNKKVWWKCIKCGHEWKAEINNRFNKSGCPFCKKIILKNNTKCDSMIEAYLYLKYNSRKIKFKYHKKYGKELGKSTCDFYLTKDNTYIEVTSYKKSSSRYFSYLRKIIKKKKYVENVLRANFEFIQFIPTPQQIDYVKKNEKT